MGGEKRCTTSSAPVLPGSPPRGRGKADQPARNRPAFRITPAWAGKSAARHRVRLFCRDHPRVGGEKAERSRRLQLLQGSPPRGRGKEPFPFLWPLPCRITPAWAGKSMSIAPSYNARGSPPRGRGKVQFVANIAQSTRITPAWAGKRLKRSHRSGIFISGPIPFHSVLHRPAGSGDSRAGRDGSPAGQPQNAGPA